MTGSTQRTEYDVPSLTASLKAAGWQHVEVVESTGSTNTDLTTRADALPDMTVLLAEEQTAGRGRLGRPWVAPRHSQVTFSVLVRPQVPVATIGLLPLVTGLAITEALRELGLDARVKWPNDVLVDGRKLCGILAEAHQLAPQATIIVGAGINVSLTRDELPIPGATSLTLEGIDTPRQDVAVAVLGTLARWYRRWAQADGAGSSFLPAYRPLSATVGEQVRVELSGRPPLLGVATDITDTGELLVRDHSGQQQSVAAGDVIHARLEALYGDPYAATAATTAPSGPADSSDSAASAADSTHPTADPATTAEDSATSTSSVQTDGSTSPASADGTRGAKAPGEFKGAKAPGEFKGAKAPGEFKGAKGPGELTGNVSPADPTSEKETE